MKAEIHMKFKNGKPRQLAHDYSALLGYPFGLPGGRLKEEAPEVSFHDLSEGEEPFIVLVSSKEDFDFLVGRFPTCQGKPIVKFEHVPEVAPLLIAAKNNDVEQAKKLLESGANVNVKHGDITPLIVAAALGRVEMVELLLKHGADTTVIHFEPATGCKPGGKFTALGLAEYHNHAKVIEVFRSHGVNS